MKRMLLFALACLALVALGETARAGVGCYPSHCHRVVVPYVPAPVAPPVAEVPVYTGHAHVHWQYFAWSRKLGCRCYYCPKARVWYFYHQTHEKYYPLEDARRVRPPAVPVPGDGPTRPVPFTRDQLPPPPDATIPGPDAVAPPQVPGAPPPVPGAPAPAPMPIPVG